jgi:hypothetical protein
MLRMGHSIHALRLLDNALRLPGAASAQRTGSRRTPGVREEEDEMSNAKGSPMAIACATAFALAVSESYLRAIGGSGPEEKWNTFSAEVTIRRGLRDAAHPSGSSDGPAVKYRWERIESGGRWKTTMTVLAGARPAVITPTGQPLTIPPVIVRIEDDGDGSEPRLYNLQGALVRPPAKSDRQKIRANDSVFATTDALTAGRPASLSKGAAPADQGRDWVDALLPSFEGKSARRAELQRRFGKAVGNVRGLSRYQQFSGDVTIEVLADDDWGVPMEINILRTGALESHATFEYEAGPNGSLVRRRSRVEHVVAAGPGGSDKWEKNDARMVLDVELANVKLEDRR